MINSPIQSPSDAIPHNLYIPLTDINLQNKIASTSTFDRQLANWREQTVEVKISKKGMIETEREQFLREIKVLSHFRDPNIVLLHGAGLSDDRAYIVTEHFSKGSLADMILDKDNVITPAQQKTISINIAMGLYYLHQQNFIHRNCNPAAIFLNEQGQAKLGEFAFAKSACQSILTNGGENQWVSCVAPELFSRGNEATEASDVYSLGLVLWCLVEGKLPNDKAEDYIDGVKSGRRERFSSASPDFYRELIGRCWAENPAERPTLLEIVRSLKAYQAPSKADRAETLYLRGLAFEKKPDPAAAIQSHEAAIELDNHLQAKYRLGRIYLKGLKPVKADKDKAFSYFLDASRFGSISAMLNLTELFEYGIGIEKDINSALHWCKIAADQGNPDAVEKLKKLGKKLQAQKDKQLAMGEAAKFPVMKLEEGGAAAAAPTVSDLGRKLLVECRKGRQDIELFAKKKGVSVIEVRKAAVCAQLDEQNKLEEQGFTHSTFVKDVDDAKRHGAIGVDTTRQLGNLNIAANNAKHRVQKR